MQQKLINVVGMGVFAVALLAGSARAENSLSPGTEISQQRGKVTGTVSDEFGGVAGAAVSVKGTTRGVATDMDGNFTLEVSRGETLVVSYIGYETQEIAYNGEATLNIVLRENTQALEEVVVTGYGGSQKRATLTTAISKMDGKVLKTAAFGNAGQALQGSVTGLRVVNTNGQPGSDANIVLRGGATISGDNNGALIIVDGIVRESLAGISPEDIESVQVLKDAASTAIYGARANGGVILVETKKGQAGSSSVRYKFKIGSNYARLGYDFLNAEDYLYYNRLGAKRYNDNLALSGSRFNPDTQMGYGCGYGSIFSVDYLTDENSYLLSEGWQQMTDPFSGKEIIFKDYSGSLEDAIFDNSAMTQEHHVSFDGGNDKGTYAASLGYYTEDGQIINTGLNRFTGSLNASYKVLPFLTIRGGTTYSWQRQPSISWTTSYNLFYRTRSARPTWNPWNEDGSPAAGFSASDGNPLYYMDKLTSKDGLRRQTYTAGFRADLLPENKLVLDGNASLYHYDYQYETFNKAYQQQNQTSPNTTREATAKYTKRNQQQVNATLTYSDSFADAHNVEVMIGGEYFNYHQFEMEAKTTGSPTDDIPTLNAGSERTSTTSEKTGYRILSAFGRINYNYNMKYLLSFTAREDGISRLADNRWGFFPGVSAGWNVYEEDFWKESPISGVISNLKPRVSYGANGNVSGIGNFEAYGIYGQTTNYDGQTGFQSGYVSGSSTIGLENKGLRWEQSQTFEAGIDIGFLKNRLSLIIDYYDRRTKDLLTSLSLPTYTGYSSITTNLGTLKNYGLEVELKANILNMKNSLTWDVSANISTVANKILKLPYNGNENNRQGGVPVGDPDNPTYLGGTEEGGKLGVIYGYKQDHIYKDWDDVRANSNNTIDEVANLYGPGMASEYEGRSGWKPIEPGDVCWQDTNGDGVINGYDRVELGNIFPNVTGGFSTTVGYKGLSLYARFDYALGHTIYNDYLARSYGQYQGSFNIVDVVKKSWTESNTDTEWPAFQYADQLSKKNITRSNNAGHSLQNNSSQFYEKGDYLALRELTLSYSLPQKLIQKAFIKEATISITGQNLCYFTGYSGTNPEPKVSPSQVKGVDSAEYPVPKTVLLGLSVTF